MSIQKSKKLQDSKSSVSLGDVIAVYDVNTLILCISGDSTNFTVQFEGSLDSINYFPISGSKMSDFTIFSTTTSTLNEAWEFDVSALASFRANLTSIANGNVTVFANAVI